MADGVTRAELSDVSRPENQFESASGPLLEVYRPIRAYARTPADLGLRFEELWIDVAKDDGSRERIHAWWWPAEDPRAPVVYYLHGVRWNLTGQLNRMSQLRRFGFSVFAIRPEVLQ